MMSRKAPRPALRIMRKGMWACIANENELDLGCFLCIISMCCSYTYMPPHAPWPTGVGGGNCTRKSRVQIRSMRCCWVVAVPAQPSLWSPAILWDLLPSAPSLTRPACQTIEFVNKSLACISPIWMGHPSTVVPVLSITYRKPCMRSERGQGRKAGIGIDYS